jgi:protein pelota
VVNENDYVRMGAYHTLDLEGEPRSSYKGRGGFGLMIANRDFRLTKTQGWDSVALERIEESTKEGRGAEVGAIVCGEGMSL